jgi:hypothetical protein
LEAIEKTKALKKKLQQNQKDDLKYWALKKQTYELETQCARILWDNNKFDYNVVEQKIEIL